MFQHTAARRRLNNGRAGDKTMICFNTQPPEGGCFVQFDKFDVGGSFNTQPPEGGCKHICIVHICIHVSTHSRPKAADSRSAGVWYSAMFQHTAARRRLPKRRKCCLDRHSFNTQPPEGGWTVSSADWAGLGSFNTQPPEGGWVHPSRGQSRAFQFQHTAARRRLVCKRRFS